MKRLPVGLLLLLSLLLATSALASPRQTADQTRGPVAIAPVTDARAHAPSADASHPAAEAAKPPASRNPVANQEIGDGHCFEYVIFGYWHVWAGCGDSGGGSGGGW